MCSSVRYTLCISQRIMPSTSFVTCKSLEDEAGDPEVRADLPCLSSGPGCPQTQGKGRLLHVQLTPRYTLSPNDTATDGYSVQE